MAVTTEEILAAARELAGRAMTDGEEKILSVLCAGTGRLARTAARGRDRRGLCLLGGGGLRTTFGGYVRTVLAKYGVAISLWKDGQCLGEGLAVVRPVLDREWQWVPTERGVSRQEKGLCLAEAALPFDTEGPLVLQWEARRYDVVNARKLRAGEESICWQAALRRREEDAA